MQEIILQTRLCDGCGTEFKVMKESKQTYHSLRCKSFYETEGYEKWVDQKNQKKKEKMLKENTIVLDTRQIQNSDRPSKISNEDTELLIKKNVLPDPKKSIQRIKINEMPSEEIGQEIIKNNNSKHKETIMQPTTEIKEEKLTKENIEETQQEDLSNLPTTSEMVSSPSMSLLDDTAKHLFGLMKSVTESHDPAYRKLQTHEVQVACDCAKNIREILKLKLEAIKYQRGLKDV